MAWPIHSPVLFGFNLWLLCVVPPYLSSSIIFYLITVHYLWNTLYFLIQFCNIFALLIYLTQLCCSCLMRSVAASFLITNVLNDQISTNAKFTKINGSIYVVLFKPLCPKIQSTWDCFPADYIIWYIIFQYKFVDYLHLNVIRTIPESTFMGVNDFSGLFLLFFV